MFIETHMHISLDGIDAVGFRRLIKENGSKVKELIRNNILAYKSRGIIAIRDGGDPINLSRLTRKIAQEEGIIYKTPIHAIYKKGHYGSFIGKPIEDIGDFKRVCLSMKREKPDFIKIPLSGMMDFNKYGDVGTIAFTNEELNYIVNYAKDENLPVMVHVNSREGIQRAIKAGVDTIEHGYYMTEEELWGLKESNIIWIPTLAPLGNIIYSNDEKYKKQINTIQKIFDEQSRAVLRGYEIGVKLAIGSDAGAYKVPHGSGYFDEFNYMNKAGIDRKKLTELAYINGCKALKIPIKT